MERQPCRKVIAAVAARPVSMDRFAGYDRHSPDGAPGCAAKGGRTRRVETADRVLMLARQVWDYWLPTADVQQRNITEGLKGWLTPYRAKSFTAIVEPLRMGELLRAMKRYKGGPVVRTALQLAPLLYQRPGNLANMEWAELDLGKV